MSHNISNVSVAPVLSNSFVSTWFILTSVILAVGSILSTLLIVSLSVRRRYRNSANLLVIHALTVEVTNMAILTPLSNTAIWAHQTGHPFHINCVPVAFFQILLTVLSNWSLVLLAINRMIAVVFPHHYARYTRHRPLVLSIIVIWILGLATTVPLLFGVGGTLNRFNPLGHCGVQPTRGVFFSMYTHVSFTGTMIIQAVCYTLVVGALRRAVQVADTQNFAEQRKQRRQRAISVVLLVVYVWYLACYLPIPVITTYFYHYWKDNYTLFVWLRTVMICGSAGTPVILLSMSREHRFALRSLLERLSLHLPSSRLCFRLKGRARVNTSSPASLPTPHKRSTSTSQSRCKVYVY
ncbi:rhodopsin-like [Paramacrobiotus metropolitanus]|uniref:rhodopsin-like n=1 Tax=Paramacrobiotus metropolitanus TaxID=2943436 RepID=UPI0024464B62|nr:rhodopsin-like [Paramacrobiotus metropolitanus]